MAVVTMEDEYELVCDLSNGAISNDLQLETDRNSVSVAVSAPKLT